MNIPKNAADWQPKMPTKENKDLMSPNAKDNPDCIPGPADGGGYKQTLGGSGKPSGPFGKQGREF